MSEMIMCLGKCLLYQLFNAQGVSFFYICIDEIQISFFKHYLETKTKKHTIKDPLLCTLTEKTELSVSAKSSGVFYTRARPIQNQQ